MSFLTYKPTEPFQYTAGPKDPGGVLFVGEAWGASEEKFGTPFAGYSGKELFRMIFEAWPDVEPDLIALTLDQMMGDGWIHWRDQWLDKAGITLTNTLALRPPNNDIKAICLSKKEVGNGYSHKALAQSKYLDPKYLPEIDRLKREIEALKPNLVICLGNTALWALHGTPKIGSLRGTVAESTLCPGVKTISTYHPSAVCRLWSYRPIVVADLMKARRESLTRAIKRPKRSILVNPQIRDINEFVSRPGLFWAVDIETKNRQIEMVGLARSRSEAIVIPFVDFSKPGNSYWRDEIEELCAWELLEKALNSDVPKIFQNGLFDLQYIIPMGLKIRNAEEDTMLLQHSLYPEMQKGLGFLGSIFTNEPAWKLMRVKSETEENKRDE